MSWGGAWSSLLTIFRLPWNAAPGDPQIVLDGNAGTINIKGRNDTEIVLDPEGPTGFYPVINLWNAGTTGDKNIGLLDDGNGPRLQGWEYVDARNGELVRQALVLGDNVTRLGAYQTSNGQAEGGFVLHDEDGGQYGFFDNGVMTDGVDANGDTGVDLRSPVAVMANGLNMTVGERGETLMTFAAALSATQAVNFAQTYPTAPQVITNINSAAGATGQWSTRAFNITTTGFTIFAWRVTAAGAGAWANVPVGWTVTHEAV